MEKIGGELKDELKEENQKDIDTKLKKGVFIGDNHMTVFLTADLHLNHKNIIRYCHRPFRSVRQMNRILVRNWNRTVKKGDTVYVIGDLAFGKNKRRWLKKLNGKIILIRGNHDIGFKAYPRLVVTYKKRKFLLVHRPENAGNWKDWVIHGHKHNNNLKRFPFINKKKKRVNVSTELTRYRPIPFDTILSKTAPKKSKKHTRKPKKKNSAYGEK